jgi:hypothetical protein
VRLSVADLGDGAAVRGGEVVGQPGRGAEEVAVGARAGAGRPRARALVVLRLVVDHGLPAPEPLERAGLLHVVHEGVHLRARDVGRASGAHLAVGGPAGEADNVPGIALQIAITSFTTTKRN